MKLMKRLLSGLMAVSVLCGSLFLFTGCGEEEETYVAAVNVDGKKSSGEWDGVTGITLENGGENITVGKLAEGVTVSDENKATVYFRYDENYLYILEERSSNYINTGFSKENTIFMKYGDSTRVNLMLYDPTGDQSKQPFYSTFIIFSSNCEEGTGESKSEPIFMLGQDCFTNTTARIPTDETIYKIKSTVTADRKSAVTEVAISWNNLFINCPDLPTTSGTSGKNVKSIVKDGLVLKFGLSMNVGVEDGKSRQYSLDYCFDGDSTDKASVDNMGNWATMTLKSGNNIELSGAGDVSQIDWRELAKEAKTAEESQFPWGTVITIVVIVIVVLLIGTVIVFKVFNLSFTAEAEDDEEEEEDDEEEEEDDDDDF